MCGYDYASIVAENLQFRQNDGIIEDNFAYAYDWEDVHWV